MKDKSFTKFFVPQKVKNGSGIHRQQKRWGKLVWASSFFNSMTGKTHPVQGTYIKAIHGELEIK